jgi:PAS domain S-box-containing protein
MTDAAAFAADAAAGEALPAWDEAARLKALERYGILDTPRESAFDDLLQIAADLCQAPLALISLVAEQRQWFKSEFGFGMRETSLDVSICVKGMLQPAIFVVPDLEADSRFNCNPLVTGQPGLRFYAGAPLLTPDGLPMGMLCVLDRVPRPNGLTPSQSDALMALARQVMAQMELRLLNANLEYQVERRTQERDRIWRLSPDMLAVAGPDGRLLELNPAFSGVMGMAEADLLGQSFADLSHAEDRAALAAMLAGLAEAAPPGRMEGRLKHAGGNWLWVATVAVRADGLIYLACRDITAEKEASAVLRLTEEQLRQSQKMEAVGQLTGGIAHDFNNMLTGIIASLDMLNSRIGSGRMQQVPALLRTAQTSANRAAALVKRLLAFSRQQALSYQAVDVNAMVTGLEDLLRQSLGYQITLETTLTPGLCPVRTDLPQLESALLNLAINARDAMTDGGCLRVSTEAVSLGASDIDGALPPGDYVLLRVADSGTGMAAHILDHAFDPFFTTKDVGKGTGLGLSMVYGFAQQTGGAISLRSQVGHGTEVLLHLPCHVV